MADGQWLFFFGVAAGMLYAYFIIGWQKGQEQRRRKKRQGPHWPGIIEIEGVEYEHHCRVSRSNGIRGQWVCACGLTWYKQSGGVWGTQPVEVEDGKDEERRRLAAGYETP